MLNSSHYIHVSWSAATAAASTASNASFFSAAAASAATVTFQAAVAAAGPTAVDATGTATVAAAVYETVSLVEVPLLKIATTKLTGLKLMHLFYLRFILKLFSCQSRVFGKFNVN